MKPDPCDNYRCLTEAVISIGSNCGDRDKNVRSGLEWLNKLLYKSKASSLYATPDCSGGPREYINAVVKGITTLPLSELEDKCKEYEKLHGRTDEARRLGNVTIDIDIVIFDGNVLRPKDAGRAFFTIGYSMI